MTRPGSRIIKRVLTIVALAVAGAAAPTWAAPCSSNCLTSGDYDLMMTWDGQSRSYKVHVPADYDGNSAVALTLDLHGYNLDASYQKNNSGQLQQSDQRGFIVVWPQGIANGWNGQGCCADAYVNDEDDVGFLKAVIAAIKGRANIDANKVYATGWSNGGGMAHRMACEAADVVRAIAPVAHPLNTNDPGACSPSQPVSVLHFHGTSDLTIRYSGLGKGPKTVNGIPKGWQSALESLATWKVILNCTDTLTATQLAGSSRDETYETCASGTTNGLVTVAGGPHNLYTDTGYAGYVDVAAYMWDHVFVE